MAFNLGFRAKYFLCPWCMLFHSVKVLLKVFSISFKVLSPLGVLWQISCSEVILLCFSKFGGNLQTLIKNLVDDQVWKLVMSERLCNKTEHSNFPAFCCCCMSFKTKIYLHWNLAWIFEVLKVSAHLLNLYIHVCIPKKPSSLFSPKITTNK